MPRILPWVVLVLLTIYCLVEVAQADPRRVRVLPRWLWAVVVLVVPALGSLAWLFLGRPINRGPTRPPPRPRAPDDDPDFLRGL
ncbi:MAG: PLDc N-terminal domain-containing protein [Micropruina sp.]|nr:MAG: PLDc N-terminal domain-containing protein [Micropruina sp.]